MNILLHIGSGARGSGNLRAIFTQDSAPRSKTQRSTRSVTLLDHVLDSCDDHIDHSPENEQFLNMPDSPDRDVEILLLDEGGPRPPAPEPLDEATTVPACYADPHAQDSDNDGDVDHLTGTDPTLIDHKEEDCVLLEGPGPHPFPPVITAGDGTRYALEYDEEGYISDFSRSFDYYDTFDVRLSD